MTKNELKTVASLAFAKATLEKIGDCNEAENVVVNAMDQWPELEQKNVNTFCRWFEEFEKQTWNGGLQDQFINLSFSMAILDDISTYLSGRKLVLVEDVIDSLSRLYYEKIGDQNDHEVNENAANAANAWRAIINGDN